jgi:hypothetical protein
MSLASFCLQPFVVISKEDGKKLQVSVLNIAALCLSTTYDDAWGIFNLGTIYNQNVNFMLWPLVPTV